MSKCDGWPEPGCQEEATNDMLGYKFCGDCARRYIEPEPPAIKGYWLLQIIHGEPKLRGPYESDAQREDELDMCLIDPGTEYTILIDPKGADDQPHAWKPSYQYKKERLDRLEQLPD